MLTLALLLSAAPLPDAPTTGATAPSDVPSVLHSPAKAPRLYDMKSIDDQNAIAAQLRKHVAYLSVELSKNPEAPLDDPFSDGFAVAIEPDLLAVQCFLVDRAKKITVRGQGGRSTTAVTVLYDQERRIALLKTAAKLSTIGLTPAVQAAADQRKEDDPVFALVSTEALDSVVTGWVLDPGGTPEYGGHIRISLKLAHGMPVFDEQARLIGVSRTVAWDSDGQLLISPETIAEARAEHRPPGATKK